MHFWQVEWRLRTATQRVGMETTALVSKASIISMMSFKLGMESRPLGYSPK